MNGYILSAVSAYIDDYILWYTSNKDSKNITCYINDRFELCTKVQKEELFNVFKNINYSNTSEDVVNLYKILFDI
ncbi:MAG: hypothetical protein PHC42_03620 [Bacilli bacterium]|nr:hypothetical protein [Bacilli bacterium]